MYRILAKSSSLFWHYACDSNPSQPVRPSEFAHSHLHRIVWQKGNQQCRVFHPYKKNYSPTIKECQKYFGTTHPLTRCPRLLEFARSGFADKVMRGLCNQRIVDCVDALRAAKQCRKENNRIYASQSIQNEYPILDSRGNWCNRFNRAGCPCAFANRSRQHIDATNRARAQPAGYDHLRHPSCGFTNPFADACANQHADCHANECAGQNQHANSNGEN